MASKHTCRRCLQLASSSTIRLRQPAALRWSSTVPTPKSSQYTERPRDPTRHRPVFQSSQPSQALLNPPPPGMRPGENYGQVSLRPNELFHSFTNSPSPRMRRRAAVMRQNAYCPHPDHRPTRMAFSPMDIEARKTGSAPPSHVRYECPDCGIPVSCSEEHFIDDYESHLEVCDLLRQINEDDHDLISGRYFAEFELPGPHLEEAQINMTNWDTLLYTREFLAIDDERSMRQATRLLTYPITIGSVLHELSPYNIRTGARLTPEGLRSFSGNKPMFINHCWSPFNP